MSRVFGCFLLASWLLVSFGAAFSQDFGGDFKKQKKGKGGGDGGFKDVGGDFKKEKKDKGDDENSKMAKLLEKSYKKSETERDKVIKEFSKLNPSEDLTGDFRNWFRRVDSGGVWDRTQVSSMGLAEIHDRIAERLQLEGTKIGRADFLRYAEKFWREGDSPPWKAAKEWDLATEADKMFKHLDRDSDGYLTDAEIPATMRAELRRWDTNGDGRIDPQEYRGYFPHRLEQLHKDLLDGANRPPPTLVIPENQLDERPKVMRAGKLLPGLPRWFAEFDTDQDGQVALFEWRRAGLPLDEFTNLDLNDDGFLVPDEVLRLLAITKKDNIRPFAYLAQHPLSDGQKGPKTSARTSK
jgi:hypothetical protein